MLANIVGPDILIVVAIIALLFGASRLPKLARSLGSAKSEFEKGVHAGTGTEAGEATGHKSPPEVS